MKSKELIRQLMENDPSGETEVCVGNVDIHFVSCEPAYYDGSLQVLIRHAVCDYLHKFGLICEFNLVRYNPPNNESKESSPEVIKSNLEIIRSLFKFSTKVQVIPRVGYDVNASCGMFVSNADALN